MSEAEQRLQDVIERRVELAKISAQIDLLIETKRWVEEKIEALKVELERA